MARPRTQTRSDAASAAAEVIRDRVVELIRVPASELQDNERNWRLHPFAQRRAVNESLRQVGIADALKAYRSERQGGALTLIDGHARREEHEGDWPVLVLDVTDEEADVLLLTLDPMVGMAESDHDALRALLDDRQGRVGTDALEDLLSNLRSEVDGEEPELEGLRGNRGRDRGEEKVLPEMELQPYENYDYVVLLARNTYDWMALQDLLGIDQVQWTSPKGSRRFGMGRVVDAAQVIRRLQPEGDRPETENGGPPDAGEAAELEGT